MGIDNEFGLRYIEFEGFRGYLINSELLVVGNFSLGLRREVRVRVIDLGVISVKG